MADEKLRRSSARITLWMCAAGKCRPVTWEKAEHGPDVPFCQCRVEAKRGGFYRYKDREPVEYLPADAVVEALENGYAAQGPLTMHPADYVTKKFELEGHEGLEYA